jgi:DNA polymerase-3 subunit epsilon/CBS domain-containing protein
MNRLDGARPLLSLDAVVIDTETTGLDPRKARVLEIAGVRLLGGRLAGQDYFRQLLKPDTELIPAASTRIHRIDNAMISEAPLFADVWPQFNAFRGESLVIGHAVGFDLMMLKRECELAGLPWASPRTLDTRLLGEIAAPELSDHSLEKLAAWVGVDVINRHSALGDATTTAQVFLALLPGLRDRNVRTIGEAERVCRDLAAARYDRAQIGWSEAVESPIAIDAEQTPNRIDSYFYSHRNRDIMRTPAIFVEPDTSVGESLRLMANEKVSSLYVRGSQTGLEGIKSGEAGIVTERDVLRAIDRLGPAALATSIGRIATKLLISVPADDFVYRAVGRMNRLKTRHLGVVDEVGHVIGALSARDVLRLRAGEALSLGDEINDASDTHALSIAWAKLPSVVKALLEEGLSGRNVAEIISSELCAVARQAGVIAERLMRECGKGAAPSSYALVVLGSAGRGESLMAMDQDNALIIDNGTPGGEEDRWFETFGTHIARILHEVGVPYCKGGVMAKNAPWRGSVATWNDRIDHWISRSSPGDLLFVDIFFDLRAVYGDGSLARTLRQSAFDAASGHAAFAKLLAESAGAAPATLKFFGGIRTGGDGRIDLKNAGLFNLVAAARAMAICHHVTARSTRARLARILELFPSSEADFDQLNMAQDTFLDLIAAQQIEDIANGEATVNS